MQHDTNTGATTLVNHIHYDTFGQLLNQTNPTQTPWFGYTGREWDAAAGLSYYRARWYDPRAGRFISEDPLSFAAGDVNLNRYVGNGATLWVDPSGVAGQPSQDDMASAMMAPLAWAQANNAVPKGAKHCGNLVFEQVFAHQGWLDYMWGVSPDVLGMVAYDGSDDNAKDLAREIARLMKLKRGLAEIRESVQTGVVAATVLVQIGNEPLDIILSTHEAITNPSWRTIGGALLSTLPLVPGIAGKADDVVDLGKAEDMAKREAAAVDPNATRRAIATDNFRGRFNAQRYSQGLPRLPDDYDAHHRIPQEYVDHPEFLAFDFHQPANIQGVKGSRADVNTHQLIT
ncbi:MAG: RHS repeat-associated core domain-containing protein, partial [Planctomycetaceae bacterium]